MSAPREYLWVGQFISRDVAYSIIDPHPDFVDKTYLVEKSAYDALKQERDECKAAFEIAKQQMVLALEGKVALAAQLAELTKERDLYKQEWHLMQNTPGPLFDKCKELEAQLAEAIGQIDHAVCGKLLDAQSYQLKQSRDRIERLERALARAKWHIAYLDNKDDVLNEIERLEAGE